MFRCNYHHQGAHYLSLLKLRLLKQSIKIHRCGESGGVAAKVIRSVVLDAMFFNADLITYAATPPD